MLIKRRIGLTLGLGRSLMHGIRRHIGWTGQVMSAPSSIPACWLVETRLREDSNSEMFAKYPFERSHRFPVNPAKSDDRDYSRLSCGVGRRSSGLAPGCLRWQELPRFSADAEMIRRQPIQQYYALHGRLLLQRERLWW